jgi:hypothetical protein
MVALIHTSVRVPKALGDTVEPRIEHFETGVKLQLSSKRRPAKANLLLWS